MSERPEWTTDAEGNPVLHIYTDEQLDAYVKDGLRDEWNWPLIALLGLGIVLLLRKK